MEIIFKNVTQYNKRAYNKFIEFHTKEFGFYYILANVLVTILFGYCIFIHFKEKNWGLAIGFLTVLIIFLVWRRLFPNLVIKKQYKSDKIKKEKIITFEFYKKFLKVQIDNKSKKVKYIFFHKIYETRDFFYFYINRNEALLLDKKTFEKGSIENFRAFIKRKCLFKYENKNVI